MSDSDHRAAEHDTPAPAVAPDVADQRNLRARWWAMTLSFSVGILLLVIKVAAYWMTGSAAVLGDAAESVVHVAAVGFAYYSLVITSKPPDAEHRYGHEKIVFFSAGFEGAMIILAACYIVYRAAENWIVGLHLEHIGWGTLLTASAVAINASLGAYLIRTGRMRQSLILVANGQHVLSDCWTSVGALIGLVLARWTGWLPWDPLAAFAVAGLILISGSQLVRQSIRGLMDVADPLIHQQIVAILERETAEHGIQFHNVRHRNLGDSHWVEVHLLFPESTPIGRAHQMASHIEQAVAAELRPSGRVTTHLEALEDHHAVHGHAPH